MQDIINKFSEYLIKALGKSDAACKQIKQEIQTVYAVINAKEITDITNVEDISEKYLLHYCYERNHTAETKLKRLCSLLQFIDYITFEKNISHKIHDDLKFKINLWRTQLKKPAAHQFQQRKVRDTNHLILRNM